MRLVHNSPLKFLLWQATCGRARSGQGWPEEGLELINTSNKLFLPRVDVARQADECRGVVSVVVGI